MKQQIENIPPAYEGVENHLLALFYSGVYITGADFVEIGKELGLDLPMKDRSALLKQIMRHAHDNGLTQKMLAQFIKLLKRRIESYTALARNFPEASDLTREWIHKANSTILLLQREMRSNPYE
ncbi:hypothetical protein NNO_0022 [Hydrogenimonas sp.]|nr:hypothetical protein NNO_0022 [Hydrogenimonas sp.]